MQVINVGGGNIVTTGALDSGSITSGFGAIDNGTSNIRSATITAETAFVPDAANGATLGTASLEFADMYLHDGGIVYFGADQDVELAHVADVGLTLKTATTSDDTKATLTLQTGDTDIAVNDVLGQLHFQAPDEGAGTDAILVAAGIAAISEGDFSASNNATKLSFQTGASEAASEKMSLSSAGLLTIADDLIIGDGKTIGSVSDPDAMSIASGGAVTFTQTPVFPDGSLALADLDIDGGTDIGAAIVDADLFIVDDGAGGTNRKTAASRLKTYIGSSPMTLISTNTLSSAASSVSVNGMDSTYKNYKIIVFLMGASDNINLTARSITGGSINTDDYHNTEYSRHENGVVAAGRVINNANWYFLGPDSNITGNASGENTNLEMTIFDPSSTALRCMISSKAVFHSDQRTPSFTATSAFYDSTDALQGVNFFQLQTLMQEHLNFTEFHRRKLCQDTTT